MAASTSMLQRRPLLALTGVQNVLIDAPMHMMLSIVDMGRDRIHNIMLMQIHDFSYSPEKG